MMFVQISKGRRREKEDGDNGKDSNNEESTEEQEAETPTVESTEEFTSVDLSQRQERGSGRSQPSRGEQFINRLKRSSVGQFFKNETVEQDISIYTIENSQIRTVGSEERFTSGTLTNRLRQTERPSEAVNLGSMRSIASQAYEYPPYRLYFLPPPDWREADTTAQSLLKLMCCQCSIACFLLIWLIMGGLIFYCTEGVFEHQLEEELNSLENSTMVSMATDLRMLDPELDPWDDVLIKYTTQHREEVISLIKQGYRNDTKIWTFPGCLLTAVSILTSIGLAAPLPQTTGGVIGAAIFALFGIPLHLLLIINLGRTVALKVQLFAKEAENKMSDWRQRIANVRRFGEDRKKETWPEQMFFNDFRPPSWLSYLPITSFLIYYVLGLLVFGVARGLSVPGMFAFFLDFARGYPSNGFSRMGYAWYLEGASILTGLNLAILRDSHSTYFSDLACSYQLITNSLE